MCVLCCLFVVVGGPLPYNPVLGVWSVGGGGQLFWCLWFGGPGKNQQNAKNKN